ncbi:hypothetical protein DAPPUDRAFT_119290 [Daphnia pulex]|uniref:Uncharacterized protein n=1 Tax=Daphnia pulex TaxID=6669 RepID=E9HY34_DAPPU|nr:hypothetical protein DAPPUDRAFT_119290 [Daphnia pulex]|eukprot:EFX63347.1 hypothetical protein DAPPUDRAFT_119290 [Daphnia pulex]
MSTEDEEREVLFADQRSHQLTEEEELEAIQLRAILFPALTFYLAPPMLNFLKGMGLLWPNSKKLDSEVLLKIMIDNYKKNPYCFPTFMQNTEAILEEALLGRRAVAHCLLPLILQKGKHFLASWIAVATILNQPEEAEKLTKIYNHLCYGIPDFGGKVHDPYARPNFVDVILTPGKMSYTEYECALLVQVYLFKADNEILAPELRKYLISQQNGHIHANSVMDTQSYLWELIHTYRNKSQYEKKESALNILHDAKEARNLLFHTEIKNLLENHEKHFQSFIELSNSLGLTKAAARINATKSDLATLLRRY